MIGWQLLRKRELPPLAKKKKKRRRPHWLQLLCGTRGDTAPLLPWMRCLTWAELEQ